MQHTFQLFIGGLVVAFAVTVNAQSPGDYATLRKAMVRQEIEAAGISHAGVLRSIRATPRHEFVPAGFRKQAYYDAALPIGDRQTISPPFVVAYMTQELDPQPTDKVLEIGTGSGYQAAVLSPLVSEVFSIEIVAPLGRRATRVLKRLKYDNVHVRVGDGFEGWPEHAPFDKIIVTCSPEDIPERLVEQLKEGGQMIIPVGQRYQQNLFRITKQNGELKREALRATLFVPMTGEAEEARQVLPDPQKPGIVNGDFSTRIVESDLPVGWHYLRYAQIVVENEGSSKQSQFLSFESSQPGRASRALQGLALDGSSISKMKLSARVRGRDLQAGPTSGQRAAVMITFYDKRRAVIDSQRIANWSGSFDWRLESKTIRVPLAAREAIVRLGILGGVGRLDVDDVTLEVYSGE
jgi:protein-L-isoaspartate(D-aspartate) O-methyltransferase